jgi:zinc and cadmium transporter
MSVVIVWIIVFTALGGVLSALTAGGFLLLPQRISTRLLGPLVSFAIGALLGTAFLALLPHAIEGAGGGRVHQIALTILLGLLGFFLLEKMVIWRHCHHEECEVHAPVTGPLDPHRHVAAASVTHVHSAVEEGRRRAVGTLILIGDGVHNLVDGVLIAAAFMTDIHLGVLTSIAVIAHEVPQELGDFALLLNSGFSGSRALVYNVLSGLTTVIGGVLAYFALAEAFWLVPYVLAVAASSFIYIAVADLIPGLHQRPEVSATIQQITLIVLGIAVVFLSHSMMH